MESKNLQQDGAPCVTRRSFVAAAATAAGSLSGCSPKEVDDRSDIVGTGADPFADCSTVYGCCSMECQHHSLKGYVRDGKLVKVEAGETNECGICPRGIARTEMVNSTSIPAISATFRRTCGGRSSAGWAMAARS